MTAPAISVIIPVFNTAPWLRRCLDSVCGQTLQDLEIICINDGSSDESAAILEEYAAHDQRVLVISLSRNRGVGVARNMGLEAASGEWLGFVDSDDSIAPDFYEKLYAAAQGSDAEIIKGVCCDTAQSSLSINQETNLRIQEDKFKFTLYWITAIYNTKFIRENNIRFPPLINGQDTVFLYQAVTHAKRINIVNDALYYYFRREGSSTTSLRTRKRIDALIATRAATLDILNANFSIDKDTYISEFCRMLQSFYLFFEGEVKIENKDYALEAISHTLMDFFKKCREPALTLEQLHKFDSIFSSLIANNDQEGLKKFLATSHLQRLRAKARARLEK